MKLFISPGACSLSPHIVAREAGIPVDLVRVNLGTKKLPDGSDFGAINPKGQVPTLQLDDGSILTEGAVIVQYLADQQPATGLVPPAGTTARYREQEWLNYVASEVHKQFSPLFGAKAPDAWKEHQRGVLASRFEHLGKHLESRPYLMGEQFTAADAYLYTVLRWGKGVGIDPAQVPALQAYLERVEARPAVQAALAAEAALPR